MFVLLIFASWRAYYFPHDVHKQMHSITKITLPTGSDGKWFSRSLQPRSKWPAVVGDSWQRTTVTLKDQSVALWFNYTQVLTLQAHLMMTSMTHKLAGLKNKCKKHASPQGCSNANEKGHVVLIANHFLRQ